MEIIFGDQRINDGEFLSWELAQEVPRVTWDLEQGEMYSLVLYDIDTHLPFVHWVVTDITEDEGKVISDYIPPNPPDKPHRYLLEVHLQEGRSPRNFEEVRKLPLLYDFMFEVEPNNTGVLDDRKKKYCDCVIEVAVKGGVESPYKICAKSVGTTWNRCSEDYYAFEQMTLAELQAYSKLKGYPVKRDKQEQLAVIYQHQKK
jgi:hypothetical protein